jgi:PrtD family type I secretion system ABC transporter
MKKSPGRDEILRAIWACKAYLGFAALFSACVNILYLTPTIYLMQVYDRILSSGSIPTLVFLTLIVGLTLLVLGCFDYVRALLLTKMGVRLDKLLAARVYQALMDQAISGPEASSRGQALRDFDTVRQFLTSNTIHVLFDVPWTPIYVAVAFLLHPLVGAVSCVFAVILLGLAILNEIITRKNLKEANSTALKNYAFTDASLRNAEVVQALGMFPSLLNRWQGERIRVIGGQARASFKGAAVSSTIRFVRMFMQSMIMGVAAYLVIERSLSPGGVFAASVLLGRSLQPIEQAVGSWRQAISARQAYERLLALLSRSPAPTAATTLPRPQGLLSIEKLFYRIEGRDEPILNNVSFALQPGESLAVIGPSAAGKSTLARLLVGVLRATAGAVRLDNADVSRWPRDEFGKYVGYLPQDVELFSGTVAENIARFQDVPSEAIVEAARVAGVHDMILRLPRGYETQIGESGGVLSGGQRQRVALARAVLNSPRLLVLDEPNSNLDSTGENLLVSCLREMKDRGSTIVIISHRLNSVNFVDKILALNNGAVELFGPRTEVLARMARPNVVTPMTAATANSA